MGPSSVACGDSFRLAVPEKPFRLTHSSGFSTAAVIPGRLHLPQAAAARNSPRGGSL